MIMHNNAHGILLIHPQKIGQNNLKYPPMGITMLASALRNKGFKSFLYDTNIENGDHYKNISEIITHEKIDTIGLSFTSNLTKSAYNLADWLKHRFPTIPIVAGGYHPTVMSSECAGHPSIDYVVVGEGEDTFPLLLERIHENGVPADIEGLCFEHNGEIRNTGCRPLISNVDDVPFPAYDLLKINKYSSLSSTRKPFVTFIRSRGCPFKCTFCGVDAIFTHKFRCQSPERTLEEIFFLIKQFKVREILFKDSDFLIRRKNVVELCELLIEKQLDLIWSCNARVDKVDKDLLKLMKLAGCNQITYGIESGSQRMLDTLKKDFTAEQVIKGVRAAKEQGIDCVGNFIIGTPGEDYESINETIQLVKKLDLDYASFHFLTAFPGSPLYGEAVKQGWLLENRESDFESFNMNASKLSESELEKAMRTMIRSFYLRPSYIMNRMKRISPNEIRNNFIGGFGLLKRILQR